MTAVWTRLVAAFVRPATPAGGLDTLGALDEAEGGPWAPPAAPAARDAGNAARRKSRDRAAARPEPAAYAVLAAPSAARAVGAATALSAGPGPALLACWGATGSSGGMRAPVSRAARRLAGSLAERGFAVRVAGRLVEVDLPEDEDAAIDALRRADAAAAACGAAGVVALAAARGEAWDGVLATRDAVLVQGRDGEILDLALAQLTSIGADARCLQAVPSRATLALATAGVLPWGGAGALRAALKVSS